jgi:hypothetical protein
MMRPTRRHVTGVEVEERDRQARLLYRGFHLPEVLAQRPPELHSQKPASAAPRNRSRNGASLNRMETFAQNLINSTGLVINFPVQLHYLFL